MTTSECFERLPCGCVMGNIDNAFILIPCSLLCEFYLFAMDEAKKQGTPIQTKLMG